MSLISCSFCNKAFTRQNNRNRHVREVHDKLKHHACTICARPYKRRRDMEEHIPSHSGLIPTLDKYNQLPAKRSRIKRHQYFIEKGTNKYRFVKCYVLEAIDPGTDLLVLYKQVKRSLKSLLATSIDQLQIIKFDIIIKLTFEKMLDVNETTSCYFHSKVRRVSSINQLSQQILESFMGLNKQVEDYLERGSGWIIHSIDQMEVHISKHRPFKGSTYIPLSLKLQRRRAIINVKNPDNKCFMWSVLSALHPVGRQSRPHHHSHYKPYINELDFNGITLPVKVGDIPRFENQNGISINLYGYDEEELRILHISQLNKSSISISLLLYNNQHYCWIKDPERFLNTHATLGNRQFQCHHCLCLFYSSERRDQHVKRCKNPDLEAVEMPQEETLKFTNFHKMHRQPYADYECILEQISTCLPSSSSSHTTAYQQHTPCGYGITEVFKCCRDTAQLGQTNVYRGEDSVQKFLDQVISWGERHQDRYSQQVPAKMTKQEHQEFAGVTVCSICQKSLDKERVIDHCHFCGSFRGAAHSQCNLQYRLSRNVVVVFHNLRRYDGHLLLERLGQTASQRKGTNIFVIPKGFDDYLTPSLRLRDSNFSWNLRFVDSYQFLHASLGQLVENLLDKGMNRFENMASYFAKQELPYLLRKGVYPYEYMDTWERFEEEELPPIEAFRSSLVDEDITPADYKHAQDLWKRFNLCNLGDYHDLYLTTDVLLLADVFENFRSFCLEHYLLDPAHYFTAPSYSWDACFKFTGVELELISDPDIYTFLESGIRGGISAISQRYAKANNPYVGEYDPSIPTSYIIYLDANNLYGWTMTNHLPVRNFQWLEDFNSLDISQVPDDGKKGYILEVDLQYPDYLHQTHNDYPLAAERLEITNDMLSPYCDQLKSLLAMSNAKTVKLVPNLLAKKNYIVHYRNLKLYLRLGLNISRVHRVLSFTQEPWMSFYVLFNTEMRKLANSNFEKDLFKLFNNSVFGKTMENVRKYIDIELVCNEDKVVKLASKLEYSGFKMLGDSLWAVKMKRATVKLNKPIYVGFTVLDLSKLLMYNFHYNYIVPKYGNDARLLFTDTDSL